MRLPRALIAAFLALLLFPFAAPAAHAATGTITGVALGADGKPLVKATWTVFTWEGDRWSTPQYGPRLTDAKGRFTYPSTTGKQYRVCFGDTYHGWQADRWTPEVRHRETCWPNASTMESAQTWTSTTAAPSKTFTIKLPKAGLGMAAVDPFLAGTFLPNEPITVVGQEGWRPTNATFSYQWMADGTPISGATGVQFTPTNAHLGKAIWAQVTASKAGYQSAMLTTPVSEVGTNHVKATSALTITGTAKVGSTITASYGKPANTFGKIDWFVDGVPSPNSTDGWDTAASSFKVPATASGARIEARLHLYKTGPSGYLDGTDAFYRAAIQIAGTRPAQPLAATAAPSGTPAIGRVLTAPAARTVSADPQATVKYQWTRASAPISGATKPTYKLTSADLNKTVAVRVSITRPGWSNTFVRTSPAAVAKKALKSGTIKISGKATTGKKVTAKAKKWGPKPVKITYQWLRDAKPIKGAKKSTYKVKKADRKKSLSVRVTVTKKNHLTTVKVSKAKKVKR